MTWKSSRTVEIKWAQNGQPRPYADSIYDATLFFSTDRGQWKPGPVIVRRIATALMGQGDFKLKDEKRDWYETYADVFAENPDGSWRVRLVDVYKD